MTALAISSCGGGSGGSVTPPPDFSLQFSNLAPRLGVGSSVQIGVSVIGSNGFSGSVAIAVSGLPAGVSASTLNVKVGASGQLTFTADSNVAITESTVIVTGTQGTISHGSNLLLIVYKPGVLAISPVALDFGSQTVLHPTLDLNLSLQNTSVETITVSGWAVMGTNAAEFAVDPSASNCNKIDGGSSCSIAINFTPQSLGKRTAELVVTDNAAASPQTIALTGNGVSATSVSLTRSNYVRTDAVTEYFAYPRSNWAIYDPGTKRFFVADPAGNTLSVLDATTEQLVAKISVPGAFSVDETPDHTTVWVATIEGDLYTVDPAEMKTTARYPQANIGPDGYLAQGVFVLADGQLALVGGPRSPITGSFGFAIWNPSTNAIRTYGTPTSGSGATALPNCVPTGLFTLSGDRTRIIQGSPYSDGTLCVVNPETGTYITAPSGREFLNALAVTPDGKSILIPNVASSPADNPIISVFDVATLNQTRSFPVIGDISSGSSMLVSPDSKTLWMSTGNSNLVAYDLSTGTLKGWMPGPYLPPISGGLVWGPINVPAMQAIDESGLIAGPMEEGVGFIDSNALRPGTPQSGFANDYLSSATGPISGGTQTSWGGTYGANLEAVYFGATAASIFAASSNSPSKATTPAVSAGGAVNVYSLTSDGNQETIPDGFSYGPTILEVSTDVSPASGQGTGIVFGYGLGVFGLSATIPNDLTISVGGTSAILTGYSSNAYGVTAPPFPLEACSFTLPAGTAGTASDVTITTSSGTSTAPGAISYIQDPERFPLPGGSIAEGVYDPVRDLYYFTDAALIQVFSRTQKKWLSPIALPAAPGGTSHRLWGIALSSDGSKLVVSDIGADELYLLSPSSPSSVQSFPVITYFGGHPDPSAGASSPIAVAVTNAGTIYYTLYGPDGLLKLDTVSGQVVDYKIIGGASLQSRLALSKDESTLYYNYSANGTPVMIDTTTDSIYRSPFVAGADDLALSPTQDEVGLNGIVFDRNFHALDFLSLNDREIDSTVYVYGMKFSYDGKVILQPSVSGIDIFDAHTGILWKRLALPFELSENYDALVGNGVDDTVVAITGTGGDGIAFLDVSEVAKPSPWPFVLQTSQVAFVRNGLINSSAEATEWKHVQVTKPTSHLPSWIDRVPHKVMNKIVTPALLESGLPNTQRTASALSIPR